MADATTPKPKRKAEKTAYHVLKRTSAEGGIPTYQLVAQDIAAHNGDHAVRLYGEKTTTDAAGKYVPVPSRSFQEVILEVETKTVIKLTEAT